MKKGLLAFLIVTLLAMSVSVFAAGESYKFVGTASSTTVSAGKDFTVNFVLSKSDDTALDKYNMEGATNTVAFSFNKDSFELVELASFIYGYSLDSTTSTKLADANAKGSFAVNGNADVDFAFTTSDIVSLKFKAKDTASAGDALNLEATLLNFVDADGEWELLTEEVAVSIDAVTVEGSTPAVPEVNDVNTTADGTTFGDYKDIPLFNCAANIKNASKVFIAPELFLDGVSHGTKAKVEIPGLTADEAGANVVIKIAVVGAPEGVVTIIPNVTAE